MDLEVDKYLHRRETIIEAIENINNCLKIGYLVRVNTLILRSTIKSLSKLIGELCEKPINHKLLQLEYYPEIHKFYHDEYVDVDRLDILHELAVSGLSSRVVGAVNGYDMQNLKYDSGYQLRWRNLNAKPMYADLCKKCTFFPCNEGLYHLYCSEDGLIRLCKKSGPAVHISDPKSFDDVLSTMVIILKELSPTA